MNTLSADVLQQIDALQLRYIDALDKKDMTGWLDTFATDDASYILRTAEGEALGRDISFILDDCRARIEDRVQFVTRVWAGTFQDYQTRHMFQRLSCQQTADGLYEIRSNLIVAFTRSDTGHTEVFVAGTYADVIAVDKNGAVFRSKKVIIDAPMLPHYLVYPL